jgi:4-hydroxybutyrate dehydrogenase/sulfolactaldehyde 3-reductase
VPTTNNNGEDVMDIGFIGLGTMGLSMARNLVAGGHRVVGYDVNQGALDSLAADGGQPAVSAESAGRGSHYVITMLPNGSIVEDALLGAGAVAAALKPGAVVIDMSTIHPLETDRIRARLGEFKIAMVDAPLGRTAAEAKSGKSLIMAGGLPEHLVECRPIFDCIGDTVIDCGGPGMGSRMKIVNNFMTTALNVLTAETLSLAESVGLNVETAIEVMSGTPAGRSHMLTTYPAKVLKGDLSPAFMIDLARKDLDIAIDLAAKHKTPLTIGSAAMSTYDAAQVDGRGAQDWTAVLDMLRNKRG